MKKKLKTRIVQSAEEIRNYFEAEAPAYREQHGKVQKLFEYRLGLLRQYGDLQAQQRVLDVGCGNGHHLRGLAGEIGRGIGVDFSRNMIDLAIRQSREQGLANLEFFQDDARFLNQIESGSLDRVICVGAFEHFWEKEKVMASILRVLKPGGKWVLMTPNGNYVWYRRLAPLFHLDVFHYSTDHFLTTEELRQMALQSGFRIERSGLWTFIPKGDIPTAFHAVLDALDWFGRVFRINQFRGGLIFTLVKPT
ncbi:MAG: hypothetical protein Kow0037_10980 [Calditrichia bacterium]